MPSEYEQIREYQIKQRAKNVAETPWLILPGENKLVRRLIKLSFIKDKKKPEEFVGVHAEVLYQKRTNQQIPWPTKTVDLSVVPKNFGFKFSLDSAQTYELARALLDAYPIGTGSLASGKRTVVPDVGKDEIVVTDKNRAEALKQLAASLDSKELNDWLSSNLDAISTDLALARIYRERKSKLDEFKASLKQQYDENYWQKFLKENTWMFGSSCIEIISERRIDIHHTTDFPIAVDGGFMDVVEIKTPQALFWTQGSGTSKPYKYRGKHLVPHPYLQGGIAQTIKYILQAEKKVDSQEYIDDHSGIIPLKPRGLVVHGRSDDWGKDEWEAFRLLNDELHNVQVVTFDHLLHQAERMLAVIKQPGDSPELEDVDIDEIDDDDIPF